MQVRPVFPALAVALIAAAAVGPSAVAAPGEGGGTVVPTGDAGGGGGATYGQPAPEREARSDRAAKRNRAKRAKRAAAERRAQRRAERRAAERGAAEGADPADHRLPLAGPFSWGGPDAQFGARRQGHRHQGQDLSAALGTPVVAPHAGTVETIGYQARGAGHYVVVDGDEEDLDYVFMHLRRGSIVVAQGHQVTLGQQLAQVGTTGRSTGPHLHFEIWVGGWYAGGHPIDPLPLLQSWAAGA
jgi:murein DD-endopeptidase MepM/ murein hydrolase activator NlpD